MNSATRKSAIVIGAGAAGLACASYLRMNGYDATVLEAEKNPGGVCFAWKRRDYLFDGATNWLPGSAPSVNFHSIWKELIDFSEMPLIDFDQFLRVELSNGAALDVFTDALKLREEMLRIAPEDRATILEFTTAVLKVSKLQLPMSKPPVLFTIFDLLRLAFTSLPLALFFLKWKHLTIEEYSKRFSNKNLRELFALIFMRHGFFSVLGLMMSLGWMHARSAGYPMGGSNRLIGLLEKRCTGLGARIQYSSSVKTILVKNGRAQGVVLKNGEELFADIIISACDGRTTLTEMLGDTHTPPRFHNAFAETRTFPGMIQVSIGVATKVPGSVHKMTIPFQVPLSAGTDTGMTHLMVRFTDFDPCFAPAGKTAIVVHLRTTDTDYWVDLRNNNRELYNKEKQRVADAVIDALDARFKGVHSAVEVVDVATPATWIRYTGNFKASYQGWAPTPKVVGRSLPKTLPGLQNFYMTGQWVEPPGGLPRVIISARQAVQIICHDDKKPFIITPLRQAV